MAESYILAHDLGTSGNKAALTDLSGAVRATAFRPYDVHYVANGGAEQDPEDWWQAVVESSREALSKAGVDPRQVIGISLSAQMLGTLPVDSAGEPLHRAMIWLDARAEKEAEWVRANTWLDFVTGKDVIAKRLWIMRNEPEVFARADKIVDCKDFILFRMTGNHATAWSLASVTGLFNAVTHEWWPEVCSAIEFPMEKLPPAFPSTEVVGRLTRAAASQMGLVEGTPVVCGGGDVPCAAVGSGALSPGCGHLYLGTSAWVALATSEYALDPESRIFPLCSNDPSMFNVVGEIESAGGCLKWFKDVLGKEEEAAARRDGISAYQLMDRLAEEVPAGADGLLFLPWLWGERAPVNDEKVRGGFACLGLNHTKPHLIRSILEGVGHQVRWVNDAFESVGYSLATFNVIGGGAVSPTWLRILADVTNVRMRQVEDPLEACARGAALTAAVGLGVYDSFAEVEKVVRIVAEFAPNPEHQPVYDRAHAAFRMLYLSLSDIANGRVPLLDS